MIKLTLQKIRNQKPLVLFISNTVTENLCANVLLALGGSPVMSHAVEDIKELIHHVNTVVINIGTLSNEFLKVVNFTVEMANINNKVVILDPVGAGATSYRTNAAIDILNSAKYLIVKGNASEVISISSRSSSNHGVDNSDSSEQAILSAKSLIKKNSNVKNIIITGADDYIISKHKVSVSSFGDPIMQQVTGMGCALAGCLAAGASLSVDNSESLLAILQHYGKSAEKAVAVANTPGSFLPKFIDYLSC